MHFVPGGAGCGRQLVRDAGVDQGDKQGGDPQRGNRCLLPSAPCSALCVALLFAEVLEGALKEPLTSQPPGEAQVLDFVHGLHVEPWGDDHGVRPRQVGMLGDLLQAVGHPALCAQLLLPANAFCGCPPVPAQLGKVVNVPAGVLPWWPGGPIQPWLGGRPNRGCW